MLRAFLLSVLCASAFGLYTSSDDVVIATDSNFRKEVKSYDGVVLVEFYAPWCGHCKSAAPEVKKAATALRGVGKVAVVDATEHQSLGSQYGVQGFPTFKIFADGQDTAYEGQRTAEAMVDAVLKANKRLAKGRLSGGGSSRRRSESSKSSNGDSEADDRHVVTLTEQNFRETVMESDEPWLVEFYAPWCGHCKRLAPEWAEAARELEGVVNLGAVDATAHTSLAQQYRVEGYPTIKAFGAGKKSRAEDYTGGRTASEIVAWASSNLPGSTSVPQLLTQSQWDKKCAGKRICVLAALPHILDSGKAGREEHLETLNAVAAGMRGHPFRFFWTEGGAQGQVEEKLGLTFGFPALVAVNQEKERYAVQRGAFSEAGITSFLNGLMSGRERTVALPPGSTTSFATVDEWDGQDAELIEEEPLDPSFFDDL